MSAALVIGSANNGRKVEPGQWVQLAPLNARVKSKYVTQADKLGRWYKVIENTDHLPVRMAVSAKEDGPFEVVKVWDPRAKLVKNPDTGYQDFEGADVDLIIRDFIVGDPSVGVDPDKLMFKVKSASAA